MKSSLTHLRSPAAHPGRLVAQTGSLLYRRLAVGRPASRRGQQVDHSPRPSSAFTVIEMMVTVSLLGFIVLGLTAMFVHTQRAFRAGVTQTDVLESGRATINLIARDLEAITPSRLPNTTNFFSRYEAQSANDLPPTPAAQGRTNVLTCFYALTQNNRQWTGIGYVVALPNDFITGVGVGTLYRFQYVVPAGTNLNYASMQFSNAAVVAIRNVQTINSANYYHPNTNILTTLTRVCDGVVGLRVQAYNRDGLLLAPTNNIKNIVVTNMPTGGRNDFPFSASTNGISAPFEYTFTSNAAPAYIDVELGILESQTYERFKGIPNTSAQAAYFKNQVGAIHVFRRRVAVHNVDVGAYQ